MHSIYPKPIQAAVKILCDLLSEHYPAAAINSFRERMEMGVYIELIKVGEKPGEDQ